MARADRLDNAADDVILSAAGVGLIYCMELAATALNLEGIRLEYLTNKMHPHPSREGSLRRVQRTASPQRNMTTRIQVAGPQFDGSST